MLPDDPEGLGRYPSPIYFCAVGIAAVRSGQWGPTGVGSPCSLTIYRTAWCRVALAARHFKRACCLHSSVRGFCKLKRPRYIETATTSLVLLLTPHGGRKMMIRTILVAAAALASVFFGPPPATAKAPWCAVITVDNSTVYWDCQYNSFEDCYRRGNILAGNRGFCNPSPYYVAGSAEQRQTRKRSARPH